MKNPHFVCHLQTRGWEKSTYYTIRLKHWFFKKQTQLNQTNQQPTLSKRLKACTKAKVQNPTNTCLSVWLPMSASICCEAWSLKVSVSELIALTFYCFSWGSSLTLLLGPQWSLIKLRGILTEKINYCSTEAVLKLKNQNLLIIF